MSDILISVIVPIYNVEEYLDDCLQSLERQTFQDIEVILVNDGSTDRSAEIARSYAGKHENYRVVERANGGLSAARNSGLDVATGEYVYFLDSDDYLVDDALEKLYREAERKQLDVLRFSAYTFADHTNEIEWEHEGGYKYLGNYPDVYTGADAMHRFMEYSDGYVSNCLILIRRDIIQDNHLRYVEGIIHEDNLFHFQVMLLSQRVAVLNEPLYCRRYRNDSITTTLNYKKRLSALQKRSKGWILLCKSRRWKRRRL